jgi:CheY-like chemotaxis protein
MAHTILLAEDSHTIQKAVEIVFDKEDGYELHRVGDGDAAIAKAKELKPQVVITDHAAPGSDGYAVAAALSGDPDTADVKVLILTSSAAPFDEGRAAGASHLQKPFDCASLFAKVAGLCGEEVDPASTSPFAHLKPAGSGAAPAPKPAEPAPPAADLPSAPASPTPAAAPSTPPTAAPASPAPSTPPEPATPAVSPAPAAAAAPASDPFAGGAGSGVASAVSAQAEAAVTDRASAEIAASSGNGESTPSTGEINAAAREIIERVVWEVVPELAEALIKEEIQRILAEKA